MCTCVCLKVLPQHSSRLFEVVISFRKSAAGCEFCVSVKTSLIGGLAESDVYDVVLGPF